MTMLTELRIKNFAIIESLTLPLARGFNVLSGETGAGKSIIVGALGLLLGERASADVIRTGADRATVEGVFDVARPRRRFARCSTSAASTSTSRSSCSSARSRAGRARAWINGTPVNAALLAEVGRLLVNLHGQHEAQTLLDAEAQRRILDAFAGATEQAAQRARRARRRSPRSFARSPTSRSGAPRPSGARTTCATSCRRSSDAKLVDGEDVRLEDEARRFENAEELRALAQRHRRRPRRRRRDACSSKLGDVARHLAAIQRIDPTLARLQESFDAALLRARGAGARARGVRGVGRARSGAARGSAAAARPAVPPHEEVRRHAGRRHSRPAQRRAPSSTSSTRRGSTFASSRRASARRARALQRARGGAHRRCATRAPSAWRAPSTRCCPTSACPTATSPSRCAPLREIGPNGAEDVEFRVALNVGHEPRPLARVASGGELSRVMLALKTILARLDHVPTLVFDEVDAGIGGRVGLQVGETMRRVAELPSGVRDHAPAADRGARAPPHSREQGRARRRDDGRRRACSRATTRVTEIARMLGGDPESDVSRAHARELLESAAVVPPPETGTLASRRRDEKRRSELRSDADLRRDTLLPVDFSSICRETSC